MDSDKINKQHWQNIPASQIIGNNAMPGEEFLNNIQPRARVLDLGCGNGAMAEYLYGKGVEVTAVDINAEAIKENAERNSKIDYRVADIAEKLPFDNESFDAVLTSFTLVNILPLATRQKVAAEISRILKPNGIIWVNEGLVSEDYEYRYNLAKPTLGNNHDFYVYTDGLSAKEIETAEELKRALNEGKIARIAHHFTLPELDELFENYELIFQKTTRTLSPRTGSEINMTVSVYKLK